MITSPPDTITSDPPLTGPTPGGLQFRDAAPMICGVVDNGVCEDDPRVMVRLNEATKIVLDNMIPVGGMMIAWVRAVETFLHLPPKMENVIEAHMDDAKTKVMGSSDITNSWYEIASNSAYLDPSQSYDNPLVDWGLWAQAGDRSVMERVYEYPGLEPQNAIVRVTGAKRYLPITSDDDYLIVQNVEALKCIILSIERYENNAIEQAQAYRKEGLDILQAEVRKHLLDPRNFMFRKSEYRKDLVNFTPGTLGWTRAQVALDIPEGLRVSKFDLTWTIQQAERRLMERGTWKDTVVTITAEVVGGHIYFPQAVETVHAIDLNGRPIPIRSQYFQYLDNGPGMCPSCPMLIDQGDHKAPGFNAPRRKYKLVAPCQEGSCISAVCKLRWVMRKPEDMMTIKNYEAIRLMTMAKFSEEARDMQNAQINQQMAIDILDKELRAYLGGIRHTIHIQTHGFGLGDVGNYWSK